MQMLMNAGADVNAQGGGYSNVLQAARQKLKQLRNNAQAARNNTEAQTTLSKPLSNPSETQLGLENVPTARYETHKPPL